MSSLVGFYLRKNEVLMHKCVKTSMGAWLLSEPVLRENYNEQIAVAVMKLLRVDLAVVPHPTNFDRTFDPLLEASGLKIRSQFVKNTKHVIIYRMEVQYTITPSKYHSSSKSFLYKKHDETIIDPDYKTLFESINRCLVMCD